MGLYVWAVGRGPNGGRRPKQARLVTRWTRCNRLHDVPLEWTETYIQVTDAGWQQPLLVLVVADERHLNVAQAILPLKEARVDPCLVPEIDSRGWLVRWDSQRASVTAPPVNK